MEVIAKIPYVATVHLGDPFNPDSRSFSWAKIRFFTSNSISTQPTALRIGSFIARIAMATHDGPNRAALDAWPPADINEWRFAAWETLIDTNEVGFFHPYHFAGRFYLELIIICLPLSILTGTGW